MLRASTIPFLSLTLGLLGAGLALPTPAAAHCDGINGPVVAAARAALETDDINLVLVWIQPDDEAEIREAFRRTQKVRAVDPEARELADLWFFETLVRVHRQGEGAPYTGLKGPEQVLPQGIAAADRAVAEGGLQGLDERMAHHTVEALREKFAAVERLRDHAQDDVDAGRRYVHAYVEFIHLVEAIHALLAGDASSHDHGG
jgi:hypothetical protein